MCCSVSDVLGRAAVVAGPRWRPSERESIHLDAGPNYLVMPNPGEFVPIVRISRTSRRGLGGDVRPAGGLAAYTHSMTANRDDLIHLIEGLPDDQVEVVLADVRRLSMKKQSGGVAAEVLRHRRVQGRAHRQRPASRRGSRQRLWCSPVVIICDTGPIVAAADRETMTTTRVSSCSPACAWPDGVFCCRRP